LETGDESTDATTEAKETVEQQIRKIAGPPAQNMTEVSGLPAQDIGGKVDGQGKDVTAEGDTGAAEASEKARQVEPEGQTDSGAANGQEPVMLRDLDDDLDSTGTIAGVKQDWDGQEPIDQQQGQCLQRYMEKMLEAYPRVEPFEDPIKGSTWWQVNDYGYLFGTICDSQGNLFLGSSTIVLATTLLSTSWPS
jgi:hypothetical protein